jgi:hypothetical protein
VEAVGVERILECLLWDGQQSVEALCRQPLFHFDQLALDHGELGDRPAPGKQAKAKKCRKSAGRLSVESLAPFNALAQVSVQQQSQTLYRPSLPDRTTRPS